MAERVWRIKNERTYKSNQAKEIKAKRGVRLVFRARGLYF